MKQKLRESLIRFSQGRYGHDSLNYAMLAAALVLIFFSAVLNNTILSLLSFVFLILVNYRALSRNIVARVNENRVFREKTTVPRRFIKAVSLGRKDREHRYVLCPGCHQICRIPRGRGTVEVTCPKCHKTFMKRS